MKTACTMDRLMVTLLLTTVLSSYAIAQDASTALNPRDDVSHDYVVESHVQRICETTGMLSPEARGWLLNRLESVLKAQDHNDERLMSSSFSKLELVGDQLRVTASPASQQRVVECLAKLKRSGVQQVKLRVASYLSDTGSISGLGLAWSGIRSANWAKDADTPNSIPLHLVGQRGQTLVSRYIERTAREQGIQLPDVSTNLRSIGVDDTHWLEAVSDTRAVYAAWFTILPYSESKQLASLISNSPSFKLDAAPSVIVYDGKSAQMHTETERSFVTGMDTSLALGDNQPVLFEPHIEVLRFGLSIEAMPEIGFDDKSVFLRLALEDLQLGDVETMEMPHPSGSGKVSLQNPEIQTSSLRLGYRIPTEHSLVLLTSHKRAGLESAKRLTIFRLQVD